MMCSCGRQRSEASDLARWESELADHVGSGGDRKSFNPDWSKEICWTKPEFKCGMRQLVSQ